MYMAFGGACSPFFETNISAGVCLRAGVYGMPQNPESHWTVTTVTHPEVAPPQASEEEWRQSHPLQHCLPPDSA